MRNLKKKKSDRHIILELRIKLIMNIKFYIYYASGPLWVFSFFVYCFVNFKAFPML